MVKASRGSTLPVFFPKNSTTAILQYLGAPSSNFPGVQDILDFNALYGIWVSAPPGTDATTNINSYYGVSYLTTLGSLETGYHVTEGTDGYPSLTQNILVTAGNTQSPFSAPTVAPAYASNSITVDKLLPAYVNATTSPTFLITYLRPDGVTTAQVTATLSGSTLQAINPTGGAILNIGSITASASAGYNKLTISGSALYNNGGYYDLNFSDSTINTWLLNGNAGSGLTVQWVQNITGMVCTAFFQTTSRSTPLSLNISKIDTSATVVSNTVTVTNINYNTVTLSYSETPYGTNPVSVSFSPMSSSVTGVDSYNQSNFIETVLGGDLFLGAHSYLNYSTIPQTLTLGTVTGITLSSVTTAGATVYTLGGTVTNAVSGSLVLRGNPVYFTNGTTASAVVLALDAIPDQNGLAFTGSGSTLTTTRTALSSTLTGARGVNNSAWVDSTMLLPALTTGYNYVTNPEYSEVKVFFDPHRLPGVATIFSSLRNGAFPFSTFIQAIAVADAIPTTSVALETATQSYITARSTLPNSTGLAYYANEFLMQESVNGTSYWGFPIGAVASMLALIMEKKLGGVAPMFTNEGDPALGGQINKTVKRAKFNFSADQQQELDSAGINPLILDSFYGLMLTSHRTAQSPAILNDWSYLGHTMAFDLFRAEMKQGVMIPQIAKAIDNPHITLRQRDGQAIMNKRLTGTTAIWDSGLVDTATVNTADTKASETFMISARVKVNEFSEWVELMLDDIAQTDSV